MLPIDLKKRNPPQESAPLHSPYSFSLPSRGARNLSAYLGEGCHAGRAIIIALLLLKSSRSTLEHLANQPLTVMPSHMLSSQHSSDSER